MSERCHGEYLTAIALIALAVFSAILPARVVAECRTLNSDAVALVERMSHSLREQNYRGIFTYQYGSTIESLNIEHTVVDGVENETLMHLSGNRRTVVRQAHPLNCVHPGHRLLQAAGQMELDCGVAQHYKLEITGHERLAGRQAVKLRISPNDMFRYGYRLAVDESSGLLLKSQIMGHDGEMLERFEFADLNVGAAPSLEDLQPGDHVAHHPAPPPGKSAADDGWSVGWVPGGFIRTANDHEQVAQVRTFTDGLAVFSIFFEPNRRIPGAATGGAGSAHQGATTAYTRISSIGGQSWLITVIGEVPVNTARRVAESVRPAA